nr:MAG TPA: hypothetical protein [Bacteriophage sp.]
MRNDFEYLKEESTKKGLATLANNPLYRLRRLELIGYVSLIANIIFVACLLAIVLFGR